MIIFSTHVHASTTRTLAIQLFYHMLFFEDTDVIKVLQEQFPAYADNFPIWAGHANAMVQYAIWTTLTSANVSANLQHYNPLINNFVASE